MKLLILVTLSVLAVHGAHHGGGRQLRGGHGDPDHPQHGGPHAHHGSGGEDHHELMSLIHEVGIQKMGPYFMSPAVNSTTMVKIAGGSKLRPAFGATHFLFMKGHFTGMEFANYAHDVVITYNAGGSIAIHIIYPDGSHKRKVLGDVQHDHHAQYVATLPGGAWHASELVEGDFALVTIVMAPALDYSFFKAYDVEQLVSEFSQYENMIRRLSTIGADDVPFDIPQSTHDHQGHVGHDHHDEHHDDHGSHEHGQESHHDDHHDNHNHNATQGEHHAHHHGQHGIIGDHDESHGHGHHQQHGIIGDHDESHGQDHHQHQDHDDSHEEDDDSHEHNHP